ncbi:MAG: ATP-dependent DNA helicase PcrA [Verrucomicrobiae bacterium]|nr:ATP-dependent DNA helicase PcrA [Verrucomicrobiae bacterium]
MPEYILHPAHAPRDLHIDYRKELNEQQHAVVTAGNGPLLVIAGAGSGKTRTLTYRVAWLVEHGIPPDRILLLTFTNKAAKEMLRRVAKLLPMDISAIWGGTFHHVGNRLLRRHAKLIGYEPDFTILDRDDQKDLLDACLADANIDTKGERFPKGEVLAEIYSLATNTERSIERVLAEQYDYFSHLAGEITKLQRQYETRKRAGNVMDYDDLLVKSLDLLKTQPEVSERYQQQFVHVLVDEYQDTNKIQADLIDALAARHQNLMVVGDDAQSIYSWRGANYRNILSFPERYPKTETFKIEVNYRSVPAVLTLANDAIKGNVNQFAKSLQPVRQGGGKPWLVACADSNQQAQFVAQRILELREEGVPLTDVAVLYRAHFHAMELQMEFTRRNIPFVITSGLRFFEQAHVKDVSSFLKLATNPNDELSFKRILRLMPGVGGATAEKLWREFQPLLRADLGAPGGRELPEKSPVVPKKAAGDWVQMAAVINQLRALQPPLLADEMIEIVVEGYYATYLKAKYPNARARQEDLNQLAAFGTQFKLVEEFLSQLALLTNLEADDAALLATEEQEYLRMSTVHQAKGQEWKVVFVIGLCDGMFPLSRSLDNLEGEEEERRLFYVAVTRAKDELFMTFPLYRASGGETGGFQRPSRFVAELPKEHYQELALRHAGGNW